MDLRVSGKDLIGIHVHTLNNLNNLNNLDNPKTLSGYLKKQFKTTPVTLNTTHTSKPQQ